MFLFGDSGAGRRAQRQHVLQRQPVAVDAQAHDHARGDLIAAKLVDEIYERLRGYAALCLRTEHQDQTPTSIVHDAIVRLEQVDPEAASVVRLKFYAGLTDQSAAEALTGPACGLPVASETHGEAVTWLPDAAGILTVGEGLHPDINVTTCDP